MAVRNRNAVEGHWVPHRIARYSPRKPTSLCDGIDGGREDCSNSGGSQGHVYGTVALRIYQEGRGAERSKSTPD